MVYPITASAKAHQHDEDGGFVIEATTIQDPISFATTLCDDQGPMWGERLVEALAKFRYWNGVLAMANDDNSCAVSLDDDGNEQFTVDFQPQELARLDAALQFSKDVLEAAGATQVCWTGLASTHVQGSCRMGDDPARSVVDRNGESHEVKRLFVGDGSLVPRTLSVNPSLTIMALATRLADHLDADRERLSRRPPGGRRSVRAALLREYHQPLELVERPVPEPAGARSVVVKVGGAGVCATDLHAIDGLMEPAGVRPPVVLGHENAGWVHAVGDDVTLVSLGVAVLVYPAVQLRALRVLPPRSRHALRAAPVHRADGRRRVRRLRRRRRAIADPAAARGRAGGCGAACGRGDHGLPRRQEAAAATRSGKHGVDDRHGWCRSHRAPARRRSRRLARDRDRHGRAATAARA